MVTPKGGEQLVAVSYHDTVNVLQAEDGSGPFARREWFALLAQAGQRPLIARAGRSGTTIALALTEANGRIEPLRCWYSFTWRPVGHDPALLEEVAQDLKRRTHRVTLWPVPDEDGSATALSRAFAQAGWRVRSERCDDNHVFHVRGRNFAEYWASRPGAMRTTFKRKAKKVTVEILDRFHAPAWAEYEAIYAESWKGEEGDPDLLRRFAEAEGAARRIRLGIARHEGVAVAAQFWTVEEGTAYIHKLAHRESARHLSAGTTLSAALFERAIDVDRVDLIDFGTGNDTYKADWMEEVRPRYRIDALDPRQPRAWPALAKRMLARPLRGG
jgi:hypothetical protein